MHRRRILRAFLLSVVTLIGAAPAAAQAGSVATGGFTDAPVAAAPQVTLVVGRVLSAPQVVTGADGRQHLAHELLLTNTAFFPIVLARLDTVDPATGAVLQSLRGAGLAARVKRLEGGPFDGTLGAGLSAVVILDATLPGHAPLPHSLTHKITLRFTSPPGFPDLAKHYPLGRTTVGQDRPIVLGPPLRGTGWVAVNGCCDVLNSHRGGILPVNGRLIAAERFAIDFLRLDAQRRTFTGPPAMLAGYADYGERVHAAAAGTVVFVRDKAPDQVPPSLPPFSLATAPGNEVVVAIGGGKFAFYAHLKPHSVRVKVGEIVRRGQVLGSLGNSGDSTAPHLHFQISDGPNMAAANSVPYEFAHFLSPGTVTNEDALVSGRVTPIGPRLAGAHRDQLPLNLEVVNFPSSGAVRRQAR